MRCVCSSDSYTASESVSFLTDLMDLYVRVAVPGWLLPQPELRRAMRILDCVWYPGGVNSHQLADSLQVGVDIRYLASSIPSLHRSSISRVTFGTEPVSAIDPRATSMEDQAETCKLCGGGELQIVETCKQPGGPGAGWIA